ncbi:MAG: D-alanine--D-alanine ligase [Pseudomonadota bacterium]
MTSFFEFWPSWLMYLPVGVQWLLLAVRYRSMTVPFLANPELTLSGMVGVAKSELMSQATGAAQSAILPWVRYAMDDRPHDVQLDDCLALAEAKGISLPFVCKPDIGCRGAGLKYIADAQDLAAAMAHYPVGAAFLLQRLASHEPEVGIFYVRDPASGAYAIESLTYKYLPSVTGDGQQTLGELIEADERAGALKHLYFERFEARWNSVPAAGEAIALVFSASHSKGAIFHDVRHLITPALTETVHGMMQALPAFNYGRLDVKFPDLARLQRGEGLEVIEINGASAESLHIWDKDASFGEALRALLWQYRTLFRIGAHYRRKGHRPPSIGTLLRHWKLERELTRHYPLTD